MKKILSSKFSNAPKLSQYAESISDDLADFMDLVSRIPNRDDYFDEADDRALGDAHDCLRNFAQFYANDYVD